MATFYDGTHYFDGIGFWGFLSVLMMSRAGAKTFTDTSTLTGNPRKVLGWFLLGATASALVNITQLHSSGHNNHSFILHKRVAENE